MSEICVNCEKLIDLKNDEHEIDSESIGEYWCEPCAKTKTVRLLDEQIALKSIINRALLAFPKAFINHSNEIILVPKYNCYFRLEDCETELIFKCKMFEWISRPIAKELHPRAANNILEHFNYLLGTKFTREDMYKIYDRLGNCVNRTLSIEFVNSSYDMSLLDRKKVQA